MRDITGNKNPMKNPDVVKRMLMNRDVKAIGKKTSIEFSENDRVRGKNGRFEKVHA